VANRSRRNKAVSLPKVSSVAEPVEPRLPSPDRRLRLLVALALVITTIGLYWPVHSYGFIPTDDELNIQTNPYLNPLSLRGLQYLWTHVFAALYIPVAYTFYAVVCLFARGPDGYLPGPFHVANMLLHVANTLLVYAVVLRFVRKPWAAGLGAALFAMHPVQVGAVAWITETRGLVSAFFALLALLGYIQYVQADATARSRNLVWWIAGTACFVLSLLSKPSAVAVPVIAAALDLWMVRRRPIEVAMSAGPWAFLAVITVLVTSHAQPVDANLQLALWKRLIVMCDSLAFYVGKLFVPWKIAFDYARSPLNVLKNSWGYESAIAGLLLIVLLAWLGRGRPWIWACSAAFAAMILPVSGLVPFAYQSISTVADRYLYLAMLGPALALAIVLGQERPGTDPHGPVAEHGTTRSKAMTAIAAAFIAVYGCVSAVNLHYWHDPQTLLIRSTQVTPGSWFGWSNLGSIYLQEGKVDLGIDATRKSLAVNPSFGIAIRNLSILLVQKGDLQGALAEAETCEQYGPNWTPGLVQLGMLQVRTGHYVDGAATLQRAFIDGVQQSQAAQAHYWWGKALLGQQQIVDARTHFQVALNLDPGNADYQEALQETMQPPALDDGAADVQRGIALASAGQTDQAIAVWNQAVAKYPHLAAAYDNLGIANYMRHDYVTAVREFNLALASKPRYPEADFGLGAVLEAEGKKEAAIADFKQALALRPEYPEAANALQQMGVR
jgi:tetratricopeptide (TPR) repeat protein